MVGQRFLRAISNRARTIRAAFCTKRQRDSQSHNQDMTALLVCTEVTFTLQINTTAVHPVLRVTGTFFNQLAVLT